MSTLAQPTGDAPLFRDVTESTGITFRHNSAPEKKYIVESMSGGVGLFDFDRDGLLDIYFVNSLTVDTANDPESSDSALYRNLGDGTFRDVAAEAGVAHPGWGMGLCIADVDGDGWQDLYVTGIGRNRLYRNSGEGTFTDVATELGVAASGWSAGCGFADYDRDGDLDLFVSRYVEFDLDNLPEFGSGKTCEYRGVAVQCGPRGLPGTSDLLFRQEEDGAFTEVGEEAGVRDPDGYFGLGIAWVDVDDDGWLDLYVANDSTPNYLYMNRKDGTFEESGFFMGVAVSEDGGEQGGMGVAVGDYDGSGRLSLFVSNFAEEYNALYRNEGEYSSDASFRSRTGRVEPALRRLGNRVLRLRQRRLGGPGGGERPRLSPTRRRPARRFGGLPPAQAALPQPGRRHLRGGGRAGRSGLPRTAGQPRPGDGRPRQRRPGGPGDQRPGRFTDGAAQRGRRRPLAAGQARGRRQEHRRDRRGGASHGRWPQPDPKHPQRHELPFPGRLPPALRPRRGPPPSTRSS